MQTLKQSNIKERRIFPRAPTKFPIKIDWNMLGKVNDLSESGLSFIVDKPLSLTKRKIRFRLSEDKGNFCTNGKLIWKSYLFGESKFKYGVNFLAPEVNYIQKIRKFVCSNMGIEYSFIQTGESFECFLKNIKKNFDEFDKKNRLRDEKIKFLESKKDEIAEKTTGYLRKLWGFIKELDNDKWILYTRYLRAIANNLFIYSSEINNHIFKKPLGYPGDFMVMKYIFNYNKGAYLGNSSYEMLINHFACNVPIANSNIKRKEFFKNKIFEVIKEKENAKILSVGSGPARELIELLGEGRIEENFSFHCLDFEKKAIQYIKDEVAKIPEEKRAYCNINYINKNLIDLIKDGSLKEIHKDYDFIYCSGIFDYLKDRIATRLVEVLFSRLNENGILILCNANNKDSFYRVAYELMGDWIFYHRDRGQLVHWADNIKNNGEIKFEELSETSNYLFFSIKKV